LSTCARPTKSDSYEEKSHNPAEIFLQDWRRRPSNPWSTVMPETFQILARFLEHFGDEVEGRAVAEPTKDAQTRLRKLAQGNLPETERGELFALLNQNPAWVGWLAQEVKALRSTGTTTPKSPE
jgi:hypothetical protein